MTVNNIPNYLGVVNCFCSILHIKNMRSFKLLIFYYFLLILIFIFVVFGEYVALTSSPVTVISTS